MLFLKMLRDMGKHKTQFISIFLMAFLGVFIYAGIGGEWRGLKTNVNAYYKKTNFADVWLYGPEFSIKDEKAVQQLGNITGTERCLIVDTVGKFHNTPKISLHFVEKNKISKMYIVKGERFSVNKDGIWIDDRFARAHKLSVGDKISITYNGLTIKKKINGTVYNPEYVYLSDGSGMAPNFSENGYAYISYKYYPLGSRIVYSEMMLKATTKNYKQLEKKIKKVLHGNYSVFLTRDNHTSYAMFDQEIAQHKSMGAIFPVAFIAIALLTMLTTMTRIVNNQRTQIGTLKALGFKKQKILIHYVSYGFWLSLAGSVLGAIVGPLTLPKLFYPPMSGSYTLPKWNSKIDLSFYAVATVTVCLCTLVTYLACRNVLRDTPSKTLRPKAPKIVKHGLLEKTALWKKLDFNTQWNLRDIPRNQIRSCMAIIGVFGCTALLICAFGMNDDMKDLKYWQYKDINKFESKLTVEETTTNRQIKGVLKKTNGQAIMEQTIEIKANGLKKSGSLTATDHVTLIKTTDENRNYINLPKDGVSLTYKIANQLGVKKGDKITWHIFGASKWVSTPVAKIYRHPSSQGIMLTKKSLEKLGYKFTTTAILAPKKVIDKQKGVASIINTDDLAKGWDDLTGAMMTMVYVLIAAAATLAIVVLYNLGLLSFTEMERELATLKVIGLKSRKLRHLLLTQNLWLSAIGFVIGVPSGKLLLDFMTSTMGDSFDMITVIHSSNILISFVITFALSILVNLMFSKKINRLDMVTSLKGTE
jgi:putative ABC transport system permease protein